MGSLSGPPMALFHSMLGDAAKEGRPVPKAKKAKAKKTNPIPTLHTFYYLRRLSLKGIN